MKSVRKRLTYANVMSSLAVFFVVAGGSALAASQLGKESVGTKQLKKEAVSLSKIKTAAKNARKGATGATGATGAKGDKGDRGEKGERGEAGPFPGTLPSGVTIRGDYAIGTHQNTAGEFHADAQSFGFTLASAPTPHFIPKGTTPPAQCPGTALNPQATAGNLCVYEFAEQNQSASIPSIFNPATGLTGTAGTTGFAVDVTGGASTVENVLSYGSWAVTAP
jgi:hypothetical protein